MDLNQIIEAIRSGASQAEITRMFRQLFEDRPELRTNAGVLGDQLREAELSEDQFQKVNRAISLSSPKGIVEETGLLGLGGPFTRLGSVAEISAGGIATKVIPESVPLIQKAAQILYGGVRGAGRFARKRPLVTLGGALAGGTAFTQGLFAGEQGQIPQGSPQTSQQFGIIGGERTQIPQPTVDVTGTQTGPQVPDPGFNVMVVDKSGQLTGTPGAIAIVTSTELGLTPDPQIQIAIANQALSEGSNVNDFLSALLASGPAAQALAGTDRQIQQVLFPESIGELSVDIPFQVRPEEGATIPRGLLPRQGPAPSLPAIERQLSQTVQPIGVPAGARISPRVFTEYRGRTMMEWAQITAQRYNVPLNLLYGIIDHESGWKSDAVGDNGQSFGLAQIYMPVWGEQVSKAQALNPVFALEWTAQKLSERFKQYGRWDAAVLAHNWPAAADQLAKNGEFLAKKAQDYVTDVFTKADRSGLASYKFGDVTANTTVAGTGPSFTPFQSPDPAQARDYITGVFDDLLGRKPTEQELLQGVEKITQLARRSYEANLRQAQGAETSAVDVQAQFEEGIRKTGEFQFQEEVVERQGFTDYAAKIANLLQQGI